MLSSNEALLESTRVINECVDLPELLEKIAPLMMQASNAERLVLSLPDLNGTWKMRVVATVDETLLIDRPLSDSQDLPIGLIESVSLNQRIWTDNDSLTSEMSSTYFDEFAIKSALCLPLTYQSKTLGTAFFEHRTIEKVFSHDRIAALEFLGKQAAVVIENEYLAKTLERRFQVPDNHEPDFYTEHLPGFTGHLLKPLRHSQASIGQFTLNTDFAGTRQMAILNNLKRVTTYLLPV